MQKLIIFFICLLKTANIFIVVILHFDMRTDIHELNLAQITEKLNEFPGWEFGDNKIKKEFKFKDFLSALDFLNKMKDFFEKNDHHPDIHIYYSRIVFELSRWDVGGKVTNMDFVTAAEIERVFKDFERMKE